MNNKQAIIKSWRKIYAKTKSPFVAMSIFIATEGELYPDDLKSWGLTPNREKHDELEFTKIKNMIY